MSDKYINEDITWPPTVDKFVNLRDDYGGPYLEDTIVNAKHYNKIAKFINVLQPFFSASSSGGTNTDGTFNGFVHYVEAHCLVSDIVRGHANNSWNVNLTVNFPGNVLPFEFIITKRQDDYSGWLSLLSGTPGWQLFQDDASGTVLNRWSNTNFFTASLLVTATISSATQTDYTGGEIIGTDLDCKHLVCSCYTQQSSDSVRVRGLLMDTGITSGDSDWTQSNRWNNFGENVRLSICFTVIR